MIKSILVLAAAISIGLPLSAQVPWQSVYTSGAGYYSIASTQNGNIYARKGTATLISTTGGGSGSWTPLTTAPSSVPADMYANNKVLFTLDRTNGVTRSLDYGATWQPANNGLIGSDSTNLTGLVALDSTHWVLLHHGNSVNKVLVSDNNGGNWSATLNMFSQTVVSVLSDGTGTAWLITTAKVYRSDDWGGYWDDQSAVLPSGGAGKTVRLSDGSFLLRNSNGFYKSTNEGVSWVALTSSGIPASSYAAQFIKSPASDTLYLSIQGVSTRTYGLYSSADKGVTWTAFDNGLPANVKLNSMSFAAQVHIAFNGYMFASPDSSDIYRTASPVTTSTVVRPSGVGVAALGAAQMSLQLYPNPACQKLSVSTGKTIAGRISLSDMTGRRLLSIVPGAATTTLDLTPYAPGLYLIEVWNGAERYTGRVDIVR